MAGAPRRNGTLLGTIYFPDFFARKMMISRLEIRERRGPRGWPIAEIPRGRSQVPTSRPLLPDGTF